jgi:predicted outer membrane repeat protein
MRFARRISRFLRYWFQPTRPIRRSTVLKLDALEAREVPANFNVTSFLDNGAAGTLRWAINQSNLATATANAIIITSPAMGQLNLTSTLPKITHQVTINNATGGAFFINGANKFQIFVVGAPLTLDKIILTKGSAITGGGDGGAIDVTKGVPVVMNTCIVNLSAATNNGGGLFSSGGNVAINHTTFAGNRAGQFGGAIAVQNANVTLTASTITTDTALGGGGIDVKNGNVTLKAVS